MNNYLQTVFHYHETTKHSQQKYANSLGYMDWSTQPNPWRDYKGTKTLQLPLALKNNTPPYHFLNSDLPSAPLVKESLSQLLQFSMGIAAYKSSDGASWAVRCNASSGNLHPTETYVVLPPLEGIEDAKSSVFHYTPKNHGLELLASFESSFWESLPSGSFLLGLSSISWREAWKYGERAFRYVNLDAGHAWQSLSVSAKLLGWTLTRLDDISDADIASILGLNQESRFFEYEHADMLFIVSPQSVDAKTNLDQLVENLPLVYEGIANKLSPDMQEWSIIENIEDATAVIQLAQKSSLIKTIQKKPTRESKEIILNRRSIHVMDKVTSLITKEQFHTVLNSVAHSLDAKQNAVHLCIFVHQVEDYKSGLYIFIRNENDKASLKNEMYNAFSWEKSELENLYFLEQRDFRLASKSISCNQDIASDGAFSLGMLANFSQQLQDYGAHRYKELYWECGMIGQELYLEATSLGLSGTGIGCYLDDMMHGLLGLKNNKFQILYHFTVGRGYVDSRITSAPPYE